MTHMLGLSENTLHARLLQSLMRLSLYARKKRRYGLKGTLGTPAKFYSHYKNKRHDDRPTYIQPYAGEHLGLLVGRKYRKFAMKNTGPHQYQRHDYA